MYKITANIAPGTKCSRCWKVLIEVGQYKQHQNLCLRCVDAVLYLDTGRGLHEHAVKNFDTLYQKSINEGFSKEEAENIAGKWNDV